MSNAAPSTGIPLRRSPRKHALSADDPSNSQTNQSSSKRAKTMESAQKPLSSSAITQSPYNDPPFRELERMRYMHSFLLCQTVKQLREICKPFKLKTRNRTQAQLISQIVLHFHVSPFSDISIRDCVSTNDVLRGYEDWEQKAKERQDTLSELYDVGTFIENTHSNDVQPVLKSILRYQREDTSGFPLTQLLEPGNDPCFSLNEFARIIILLRDDELAKKAFENAYSKTLTRLELDARVSRDSFSVVIANRFNDATVDSKHDFSGRLDEVKSNERPLCIRSAAVLERKYDNIRKVVTVIRAKWSKSGQNDPTNFVNFLRKAPNTGELTAESKRAYVFIIVTRMRQPDETEDLLAMTSKLIEEDDGGVEKGFLGGEENNEAFPAPKKKGGSARNSGNGSEIGGLSKAVDRVTRVSEEQTAVLRDYLVMEPEKFAGPQKTNDEKLLDGFDHRLRVVTLLNESSKQLKIARELGDMDFVRAQEWSHQDLLDQFNTIVERRRQNGADRH